MTRMSLFNFPFLLLFILLSRPDMSFAQEKKQERKAQKSKRERLFELMDKKIETIFKHYKEGEYAVTIDEIEWLEKKIKSKVLRDKYAGLLSYWKGMVNYRLQNYHIAVESFAKAIKKKYQAEDIYYTYGQCLYALDELERARRAFAASIRINHRPAISLYYIGFAYQLQGDKKRAVRFYRMVEKVDDPEKEDVTQAAVAQIGDIYLEQVLKQEENRIEFGLNRFVFPNYEKAIGVDSDSPMAGELDNKLYELKKRFDLVQLTMRNGKKIPRKKTLIKFSQAVMSDDNVTFESNDTSTNASNVASIISVTDLFARYRYAWKDFAFIMPEVRGNFSYHFNRDNKQVFANDNYSYNYGLRTSWEHTINDKPASFLLDYLIGKRYQDYQSTESFDFFNETRTFIIGERLKLFDSGNTTFRYIRTSLSSFDSTQDSVRQTFRAEQITSLFNTSAYFAVSASDFKIQSEDQNNRSLSASGRFFFPSIIWGIAPTIGMNYSVTDPYNQKEQRGIETLINPNLTLSKLVNNKYLLSFNYSYLSNDSKDTNNFAFKKTVMSLNLDMFF